MSWVKNNLLSLLLLPLMLYIVWRIETKPTAPSETTRVALAAKAYFTSLPKDLRAIAAKAEAGEVTPASFEAAFKTQRLPTSGALGKRLESAASLAEALNEAAAAMEAELKHPAAKTTNDQP